MALIEEGTLGIDASICGQAQRCIKKLSSIYQPKQDHKKFQGMKELINFQVIFK